MEIQIQLPDACRTILSRLTDAGHRAYAVGGCVRDSLLGRAPHDWDIATDARPAETQAVFRDFPVIETGIRHGTVTVLLDGEPYEITTFRVDGRYSDGRRPDSVSFAATIEEDLARRDFTVNAMAYSETEGLVDPFGGRQDLRDGLLRCVGDPETRFSEDALRLFRAVRFAAELGFSLEPETRRALDRLHGSISRVAKERIFAELKKLLTAPHAADALRICPALLFSAVPELAVLRDVPQHSRYHIYDVFEHTLHALDAAPPDETVRLAVLLHDTGKGPCRTTGADGYDHFYGHPVKSAEIARRALQSLRCDNRTLRAVVRLVELHDLHFPMRPVKFRRLLAALGFPLFYRLLDVARADSAAHAPEFVAPRLQALDEAGAEARRLEAAGFCRTVRQLRINGDDLIARGLRGREIGETLDGLLRSVIDGQLENDRSALLHRVEKTLERKKGAPRAPGKDDL